MVYMGSKRKYCKDIVPIIQKYIDEHGITVFIDCFCGGANLADKIKCESVIANDLSPSLIALHQQVQYEKIAFNKSSIPETSDRAWWNAAYADWKKMKKEMDSGIDINDIQLSMPLWKIGAIEWYASFGNGGFSRGYAKPSCGRDYYNEAYRNHQKQADEDNYKKINFIQGDYKTILDRYPILKEEKILFYCDSPYKGTKPYAINPKFNFEEYYNWLRETAKTYPIFISEQEMPEDFTVIWEKEAKRTISKDNNFKAVEKLFLIGG